LYSKIKKEYNLVTKEVIILEKEVGKVIHVYDKISVGVVALKGKIKVGDQIHVKGNSTDFNQTISSMQIEHQNIQEAKKGAEIGMKFDNPVKKHDTVFLATD